MSADVAAVAAAVRAALTGLPSAELTTAEELLNEASSDLHPLAMESNCDELGNAVRGFTEARAEVDRVRQVCRHVVETVEGYLDQLGAGAARNSQPPEPIATSPSASVTPGAPRAAQQTIPSQPEESKTVAEEQGEVRVFRSFSAARRALGRRDGHELHHIVEQCQQQPRRSGFSPERLNTTDNLMWLPTEIHRKVTAHYAGRPPGQNEVRREAMNHRTWDEQHRRGLRIARRVLRERKNDE